MSLASLLYLLLTLVTFWLGTEAYLRWKLPLIFHPVIVGCVVIAGVLATFGLPYPAYYQSNNVLTFLLGPATVALAIPLQQQLHHLRQLWKPLVICLPLGALTAAASAVLCAHWLGAPELVQRSLAAKSVTTPIAMATTEILGGIAAIAAGVVALTGILTALMGSRVFQLLKLEDPRLQGFALGLVGHGMGTVRAFEISPQCGAFASLGLGLTGILTALCLPFVYPILHSLT